MKGKKRINTNNIDKTRQSAFIKEIVKLRLKRKERQMNLFEDRDTCTRGRNKEEGLKKEN